MMDRFTRFIQVSYHGIEHRVVIKKTHLDHKFTSSGAIALGSSEKHSRLNKWISQDQHTSSIPLYLRAPYHHCQVLRRSLIQMLGKKINILKGKQTSSTWDGFRQYYGNSTTVDLNTDWNHAQIQGQFIPNYFYIRIYWMPSCAVWKTVQALCLASV
jgi:hypothetical protein